jgi:hypothetical protein
MHTHAHALAYAGEDVRFSGVLILEERHADTHFASAAVLDIPLQTIDARFCKIVAHSEFHNSRKRGKVVMQHDIAFLCDLKVIYCLLYVYANTICSKYKTNMRRVECVPSVWRSAGEG